MLKNTREIAALITLLLSTFLVAEPLPPKMDGPFELSPYTGVANLVKLGDPLGVTLKQIQKKWVEILIKKPELRELKIEQGIHFPDLGIKVFYRNKKAVLILFQEPFQGLLRTSNIKLFPFESAPQGSWEDYLIKKLGKPKWIVTGGRLNSKGLYYSWGDISFNAMGPNQIALYRDPAFLKYREKDFGREISLSPASDQ